MYNTWVKVNLNSFDISFLDLYFSFYFTEEVPIAIAPYSLVHLSFD